jgi:hypothetical protein
MAGVLDVLLDLPLLPARRRIAELRFEQEVTDHRREARVHPSLLPAPDPVYGRSHVVVDAAPGNAAQDAEGVIMGVEQHLVRLLQIGAEKESPALAELEVGDLELLVPIKVLITFRVAGELIKCSLIYIIRVRFDSLSSYLRHFL